MFVQIYSNIDLGLGWMGLTYPSCIPLTFWKSYTYEGTWILKQNLKNKINF